MSFAFVVTTLLLGSSMMNAIVLHSPREEPAAAADAPVSGPRCQSESWQSIRKNLLGLLNLQTEPRLPAEALNGVREQWNRIFNITSHTAEHAAAPGYSAPADDGNSPSLTCCSMASEIFMKDVGWDSWVIHPLSLSFVQCVPCKSPINTVQCPSNQLRAQDASSQDQLPCCEPTSREAVPIVYMDEHGTVVISSVQLTRGCGCGTANAQEPGEE